MRARWLLVLMPALVGVGCDALTTITLGAEDGVAPIWYEETISGLPRSYSAAEWPDGTWELHLADDQVITMTARTRPDGGRDVTLERRAWFLNAESSAAYRDAVGADRIEAIDAIVLELLELEVETLDPERVDLPSLAVVNTEIPASGEPAVLTPGVLAWLRNQIIAGQDVRVPISMTFHLGAEDLDALPSRLHLYVRVQPTLYVNVLDSL